MMHSRTTESMEVFYRLLEGGNGADVVGRSMQRISKGFLLRRHSYSELLSCLPQSVFPRQKLVVSMVPSPCRS